MAIKPHYTPAKNCYLIIICRIFSLPLSLPHSPFTSRDPPSLFRSYPSPPPPPPPRFSFSPPYSLFKGIKVQRMGPGNFQKSRYIIMHTRVLSSYGIQHDTVPSKKTLHIQFCSVPLKRRLRFSSITINLSFPFRSITVACRPSTFQFPAPRGTYVSCMQ